MTAKEDLQSTKTKAFFHFGIKNCAPFIELRIVLFKYTKLYVKYLKDSYIAVFGVVRAIWRCGLI